MMHVEALSLGRDMAEVAPKKVSVKIASSVEKEEMA